MSLNIKNEETHRLARQLATLTGESMTAAITAAVRECLERVRHETDPDKASMAEVLLEIGRDCAPRLVEPYRSTAHGDLLYDDRGLPG